MMTHAKTMAIWFFFAIAISCSVFMASAKAQGTVYGYQNNSLIGTGGAQVTGVNCADLAALRTSKCVYLEQYRSVAFDVNFVDADASAASLDVTCYGSKVSTCAILYAMPVITATAATGVSNMTVSTWRWLSTAGGAPGTSNFVMTVSNIPDPFVQCVFTCGAGGGAADTITVYARGLTP